MFENAMQLSPELRVRWTLNSDKTTAEIGLEGIVPEGFTMNFGVVKPVRPHTIMMNRPRPTVGPDVHSKPVALTCHSSV